MEIPKNYKALTRAAKRKGKSELEIYECVSECVDDILKDQLDKCLILRALLAYIEGNCSNSWYVAIMPIAYALIIGAASLMPNLGIETKYLVVMIVALLVCALIATIVAMFNLDFEKKMVICVLNDKLEEHTTEPEVDVNVTGVMLKDKKKKPKGKKKHKKKK